MTPVLISFFCFPPFYLPTVSYSLVEHIVNKFMHCFEGVEHVTTFKNLVRKHEQNLELRSASRHEHGVGGSVDGGMPGGGHMSAIAAAEWRKARELDDDEAYFETSDDSDDQETTSTGAHASGSPLSGSAGILALDRMGGLGGASSDSSNARACTRSHSHVHEPRARAAHEQRTSSARVARE